MEPWEYLGPYHVGEGKGNLDCEQVAIKETMKTYERVSQKLRGDRKIRRLRKQNIIKCLGGSVS